MFELIAKYNYDSWNRLVREDNYVFGKSYTYKYDQGGNIIQRTGCCFCEEEPSNKVCCVDTFQYATSGWKDQLISYNGKTCEYDVLGNLTQLGDKALTWTKVRKLASFGNVTFTYDAKGMRTGKSANGVTHSYIYEGDLLLKETIGNNTITYYHGNDGIIGFNYLDTDFFYRKNLQGDVIAICTADGTVLAKYVYDAWGNHKVYDGNNIPVTTHSHIGYINPIRYRGYYYDVETKLYYCQTRYYSPELCRWISADTIEYLEPESIHGLNLYCYCLNNPVMYVDPSGHFAISTLILGAIIGAAVSFGASVISQSLMGDKKINWSQVALDTIMGGISGALGTSGISQVFSIIAGGVLGAAGSVVGDIIAVDGDLSKLDVWKVVGKAAIMGGVGAILGKFTGAGTQNTKVMVDTINVGKSWGSKAFLTSAKDTLLRPNSGLTIQTMYMNMAKAIGLYTVQGITKVSAAVFGSTFLGNSIGW